MVGDAHSVQGEHAMPNDPIICVRDLWAGYEDEVVLENVDLDVYRHDFIGLIGPNGGGKTTLLRVLLGLLTPMRGTVEIMGLPVTEGRRFLGYVPQLVEFDHDFPISVWDVARMGRIGQRGLLRRYSAQDDEAVHQALERVEMSAYVRRPIGALSGGQRQRVYIARALAANPQVLLLDEPTASVDPEIRSSIYELLHVLNQEMTILLVTHDLSAISTYVKTIGCVSRHLFYEGDKEISQEMIDGAYHCPVDLIAHGLPHRVLPQHDHHH